MRGFISRGLQGAAGIAGCAVTDYPTHQISVLAIDPAYSAKGPGCACALFCGGRLSALYYARPSRQRPATPDGAVVVWEIPEVRPREDVSPGKANTLVRLAAEGAALAGMYAAEADGTLIAVTPAQWKGSTPKPAHHKRVLAALDADEPALRVIRRACGDDTDARVAAACRAGGLDRWAKPGASYYGRWTGHNLLDAVGLGLWYLERNR